MTKPSAGERLAQAAFDLFDERGFEQTTVDDITDRAGLGRATFFRHYRSKDDVIFPDHDRMLGQIRERLQTASRHTAWAAVSDAVRLVLLHYLEEGELARRRYALTSSVPALRDREIASVARYQRLFREFIAGWMAGPVPASAVPASAVPASTVPGGTVPGGTAEMAEPAPLRAELMAAAVVAAHNHVLRRWLRGESPDPVRELDDALKLVISLFTGPATATDGKGATIVAFRTGQDIDSLIPVLRRLADE
jgi:AcrR family transcriptional regulator